MQCALHVPRTADDRVAILATIPQKRIDSAPKLGDSFFFLGEGVVGALGMVSSFPPWTMVSEMATECRTPFGVMSMRSASNRRSRHAGNMHADNDA
jgi:hypothetical protein